MTVCDQPHVEDPVKKINNTTRSAQCASSLLKASERVSPVATRRRVPDGTQVYCVGDIHGRDDLLRELAERIGVDLKTRSFDHAVTVFLGDYIDRGNGSMRVIEQLASAQWPTSIIALAGNHEDFLMAFLDDAAVLDFWRGQGGLETLHSYGVDVGPAMAGRDFGKLKLH